MDRKCGKGIDRRSTEGILMGTLYLDRMARPITTETAATHAARALAVLLAQFGGCLALMDDGERKKAERLALDAGVDLVPPRVTK